MFMEAKKKPDMRFKTTGLMVLVIFLASLYFFIAFSTMQNHATCIPHSWQTDAFQIDRKLQVEKTYNIDQKGKSREISGIKESKLASREGVKQDLKSTEVRHRQMPEQCTASELNRRSGTIILTTTNAAYLDFTENWLASIQRTRACPNISVVTEDQQSYQHLSRKTMAGLHVLQTQSGLSSSRNLVFDTKEYKKFVNKRQGYILDLLEQGWEVLFSDVDTFWFRDPFPFLQGNFDIALEEDIPKPKRLLCAGFVYFRPTERTLRFVREWIRFMENDKTLKPDQIVMNIMIRRKEIPGLKLRILNSDRFPNGKLFFNETWRRDRKGIVVVHNNWIVGHDSKVERFRNCNMWLVDKNMNFTSS